MDKTKLNAFKDCTASPLHLRACNGNNTGVSVAERDTSISEGFRDVVDLCYKNIDNQKLTIDTAIYPFMFNCRHSLELMLKQNIRALSVIECFKTGVDYDAVIDSHKPELQNHNLQNLVTLVLSQLDLDDQTAGAKTYFDDFDTLLGEFYIDEASDTYRYTLGKDKSIHLQNEGLISAEIVYLKYDKAYSLLSALNALINDVNETYFTGTYTNKLSRNQLEQISNKLPQRKDWGNEAFLKAKKDICDEYNLSSNDFSKALNKIQTHPEFCSHIGMEIPFESIQDETFAKVGQVVKILKNEDSDEVDLQAEQIFDTISKEEIALLFAFGEMARYHYYSENLSRVYSSIKELYLTHDYVLNKYFKHNSQNDILNGMKLCGQTTYFNKLSNSLSSKNTKTSQIEAEPSQE